MNRWLTDFAYPDLETMRRLYRAWERFRVFGEIDPSWVKPHVQESWKRSVKAKVDFEKRAPLQQPESFQRNLERHASLLEICLPVMEELFQSFAGAKALMILSDAQATILKTWGDQKIQDKALEAHIVPAGLFGEEAIGTNALPLAVQEKQPVFITRAEHFSESLHTWSCFSVPVVHPVSRVVSAVLDISSTDNVFHSHVLSSLLFAARSIEQKLWYDSEIDRLQLICQFEKRASAFHPAAVMAVDTFDRVVAVNSSCYRVFEFDRDPELPAPLGEWVPDLLPILHRVHEEEQESYVPVGKERRARVLLVPCRQQGRLLGWLVAVFPISMARIAAGEGSGASAVTFAKLVGSGFRYRQAVELARRAATTTANILLLGETGTGKEMFAQAIHHESDRKHGPFIAVNCGAIPKDLIASELFGYEEGAFSGARRGGKKGKFELADGGTIFLDEIGELPLDLQVYLLRVLQTQRISRLGGTTEIPVNVRVIAATNKDLYRAAEEQHFRKDLLFRLNVVTIQLPTLVERGAEDIVALTRYFVEHYNEVEQRQVELSPEVWDALLSYSWPGNVRELENVVHHLVIVAKDRQARLEDLPPYLRRQREGKECSIDEAERQLIGQTLMKYRGNYSQAARALGISRSTLYRKVAKYGL